MEALVKQLWEASEDRRICRISLRGEPFPRLVHPYGVCLTGKRKIMLVCWQSAGFTKAGGEAGFRNLQLEKVGSVEVLEQKFHKAEDFNPQDGQYRDWVYHI